MSSPDDFRVRVSPFHEIRIAEEIFPLIERPQDRDYVIRNVARKMINQQPLVQGDLVISGHSTRNEFPLANQYPVHFRKTYYPICFHQNPEAEFLHHQQASQSLPLPPPIGWSKTSFRSCFLPGVSFRKLSPFGVEPEEQNITLADELPLPTLIGLWELLVQIHAQVLQLHQNGLVHGDLYLHNVIVSTAPLGLYLIDFETAQTRDQVPSPEAWIKRCQDDLTHILKHALYLQCALGRQQGPLAEQSIEQLDQLFSRPRRFRAKIEAKIEE